MSAYATDADGTKPSATPVPWRTIGQGADFVGGFIPTKKEYMGDKGDITAGIDAATDKISDVAMDINPAVGTAIKVGSLVGKGINALGGGTDGMTGIDAVLGSNVGTVLTLGLNGFTGKTADTLSKDYTTWAGMGAGYGGSLMDFDKAMSKQGKKYGGLSNGARQDANAMIHEAGRNQNLLSSMFTNKMMSTNVLANQSGLASEGFAQSIQGGTNFSNIKAAKKGGKFFDKDQISRTEMILAKKKQGGTIEITPFVFDTSALFEKGEVLKGQNGLATLPVGLTEDKEHPGYYLTDIWDDSKERKNFMKSVKDFVRSKDLSPWWQDGKLMYIPRKEVEKRINGAISNGDFNNPQVKASMQYVGFNPETCSYIYGYGDDLYEFNTPINPEDTQDKIFQYKEGGSIIPEGALHARKHHLEDIKPELDGQITSKGIPVIIDKGEGEVEQQAEIELNEIIFQKDITDQIEKATKEYYKEETSQERKDELAINIGKLLSKEVMENTDDRTGLIDKIE